MMDTTSFRQRFSDQERGRHAFDAICKEQRRQDYENARRQVAWNIEEWTTYVLMFERDARIDALVRVFERLGAKPFDDDARLSVRPPDDLLWLVEHTWGGHAMFEKRAPLAWVCRVLANSGYQILQGKRLQGHLALPPTVRIWRGFWSSGSISHATTVAAANGHSWSLNKAVATRFGKFHRKLANSFIASADAPRDAIFAYLGPTYDDEVIVLKPEELAITIEPISPTNSTFGAIRVR